MTRAVPALAVSFVRQAEREVLRVYDDAQPAKILEPGDMVHGTLTAGVGHTGGLSIGMTVTPELSAYWVQLDLEEAAARLAKDVKDAEIAKLSDHQYSALLSFVFNLGADPQWTIWQVLNHDQFDGVPAQMMRFDKAKKNGVLVEVPGLMHRRMAEVTLWKTPDSAAAPIQVGSQVQDGQAVPVMRTPDTVAPALAIIAQAPAEAPPSSVTRVADTPPTPQAMKPLHTSKSFLAQVGTLGATIGGAAYPFVQQLHDGAQTVADAIKPYTSAGAIERAESLLMIVLAGTAAVVVLLRMHQHEQMQNN